MFKLQSLGKKGENQCTFESIDLRPLSSKYEKSIHT